MARSYFAPRGLIPRKQGIGAPGFLDTLHFANRWIKRLGFDERLTDAFQWATYLQNANHLYWKVKVDLQNGGDLEPVISSLEAFNYIGARKALTGREQPALKLPNRKKPGRHRHPEIVVFLIAMRDIFDTGANTISGPTRGKGWSRHKIKNNFNVKGGREHPRVLTEFETMATEWLRTIDAACNSKLSTTIIKQAKALYRSAGRGMSEADAYHLRTRRRARHPKKRTTAI
jgi:hypothetical protein